MKKVFIFTALMTLYIWGSCSSDDVLTSETDIQNDSIDVCFNFNGDFDVIEKPFTRGGISDNVYYHIRIKEADNQIGYETFGYVGVFTDLKYARIRLARNTNYIVDASALRECSTKINISDLSSVYESFLESQHSGVYNIVDTINVLNKFSSYLYDKEPKTGWEFSAHYSGAVNIPEYDNESIERFYNHTRVCVVSNETVNIELKRFSYRLTCEMDSPSEGLLELSCVKPYFKYSIDSNGGHLTKTDIFSLGGTSFNSVSKTITLKLEHFNNNGLSTDVSTKDIIVKPNMESIIKVNYDKHNAENSFNLTLDTSTMGKEILDWE